MKIHPRFNLQNLLLAVLAVACGIVFTREWINRGELQTLRTNVARFGKATRYEEQYSLLLGQLNLADQRHRDVFERLKHLADPLKCSLGESVVGDPKLKLRVLFFEDPAAGILSGPEKSPSETDRSVIALLQKDDLLDFVTCNADCTCVNVIEFRDDNTDGFPELVMHWWDDKNQSSHRQVLQATASGFETLSWK